MSAAITSVRKPPTSIKEGITSNANLRKEYVVGGGWSPLWMNFLKSLPPYIDDITQDFGPDLYERMLLDSQVASSFNLYKLSILAQGIQFVNPKDQTDKEYDDAETIRQFHARSINRLNRPFEDTMFEMLDAMALGNKIAEKTYQWGTNKDSGKLVYSKISVKPRTSAAMLVDGFMNIRAIVGISPQLGRMLQTQVIVDPAVISLGSNAQIWPREKFMIFSNRMKDNDPRGTSMLRPAYNPWWIKTQVWPEYLKYLAQFAGASLIGFTSEGALSSIAADPDGNVILDPITNQPVLVTPEEVMLATLLQFHNSSAAAFPYGSVVQPLEMNGDGEAFSNAIALFDQQITRAILYQTLATGDSKFMARAASETHQDVLDLAVRFGKLALARFIDSDFTYDLIRYNFGQYAAENLAPKCILPSTEIQDFSSNAAAIATLMRVGYFADEQLPEADAKLGLHERNITKWTQMQNEERQAKLDQMKASAQKAAIPTIPTKPTTTNTPDGKPVKPKGGVAANITDPDSRG